MTPDKYPEHLSPEIITLIEAVIDGTASDEQVRDLESHLGEDAAARSLYLDYADLQVALRRRYGHNLEEADRVDAPRSPTATPVETSTGGSRWGRVFMALAASLMLITGSFALRAILFDITDQSIQLASTQPLVQGSAAAPPNAVSIAEEQRASLNGVAVLTKSVNVQWSQGSRQYSPGTPVPAGNLSIDSGLVQLEFYCGAVTVIEGPASLDLITSDKGFLRSGKFRARVPKQARGFTIMTRSGDIEDLGTEFAIDVPDDQSMAEVHVLDGEIRFHPKSDESDATPRHVLAGQALQFDESNAKLFAAADRFIGAAELEEIARRHRESIHDKWLAYREQLLADPDLVAYYAHSPEPRWSRVFRNYAPSADDDSHGAVVGCDWVAGRWPGTKALQFRNASHRVCVNLPGQHESLTLATWIAIDDFHPTNKIALMHPDLKQPSSLHWTVDRGPNGATLHLAETVVSWNIDTRQHYNSIRYGVTDADIERWIHLAVVYDAKRRIVSHYSDGVMIGSKPIETVNPLRIGIANLGNWPYRDWAKGTKFETRNLNGRLDEFVVVSRAMQDDEIAEMHRLGNAR